ncbi:MAG: hypothetical protein ABW150_01995, partial [Candidatus Thiodiazotropha sp.]
PGYFIHLPILARGEGRDEKQDDTGSKRPDFWLTGTASPYPVIYQRAGAALIACYPGSSRSATLKNNAW